MASPLNRYNFGLFNSGTYTPFVCDIEDITQEMFPVITTTEDHGFVVGNQVQFFIPPEWGMRQLNGLKGYVITVPQSDQISVNINTTNFDAFEVPSPAQYVVIDPAQVAGIGDINTGTSSPGGIPANPNTVPGAFQNQYP